MCGKVKVSVYLGRRGRGESDVRHVCDEGHGNQTAYNTK